MTKKCMKTVEKNNLNKFIFNIFIHVYVAQGRKGGVEKSLVNTD